MFPEKFRMDGKVALITGAGRGIGLGMAEALASAGCAIAIQDIEKKIAEQAAEKIRALGVKSIALGGDISDLSLPEKLIAQTRRQLGGFHVLINNAAIQSVQKNWEKFPRQRIELEFRADIIAPILLCQQAAKIFRKQKWGRIINMGSIQGRSGTTIMLPYSLTKAAIEKLSSALAKDLAKDGITINTISPGWFNTWRNRATLGDPRKRRIRGKRVPMGRIGEPRDCAGVTLLLCSDAGEYITGQNIYVTGGF
jgi:NAD(P)-dependent dehydrogenase (short-subunit alcohol dehydrogenase family)